MAKEKIKVKILGVSAGHRKHMNTFYLVLLALKAVDKFAERVAEIADIETEIVDLADKEIKPCLSYCEWRHMPNKGLPYTGKKRPAPKGCPITNDYMAKVLIPKMFEADGFVFGSPTFTWSYTSKFRLFTERWSPLMWGGGTTGKPAAAITVGEMPFGGEETCLHHMNQILHASEMLPVSWYAGVTGVSGPPRGPHPSDKDYSARIGASKDRFARWLAVYNGRRVAEYAVMIKIAKKELGEVWEREFIKLFHPPKGDEPWAWDRLDKEVQEDLENLTPQKAQTLVKELS